MKIFILSVIVFTSETFAQDYTGKLGYGFSPRGHPEDYSQMGDFLQEAANTCNGSIVFANGIWRDSLAASGTIPDFQKTISLLQPEPYPYVDMVCFGWGTPSNPYTLYLDVNDDSTNNWTNSAAQELFLQMLIHIADSLQPAYLFIGNEINFYWEQDSSDYLNWVHFYHDAYDSIKMHSNASKVGVVFNYEHLSGNGKLIGWNTAYWNALKAFNFNKMDILGLTIYPFYNYKNAASIPLNYLEPVFDIIGEKPVAITETGWPADSILANWYCSATQQVDYVNKLFAMINGHDVEVVNWLFLNYLMDKTSPENQLACSIALRDSLGNDRPALSVWLSHCPETSVIDNVTKLKKEKVNVYPNPFRQECVIETDNNFINAEISIYDIFGQTVKVLKNIEGRQVIISGNHLNKGIYFYKITEKNKLIASGKLVFE